MELAPGLKLFLDAAGTGWGRFIREVMDDVDAKKGLSPLTMKSYSGSTPATLLEFKLDDELTKGIADGSPRYNRPLIWACLSLELDKDGLES